MENKEANIPNRILFVDDEENVLRLAQSGSSCLKTTRYLRRCPALMALQSSKRSTVPVIVSDQRMPVMTGAEFLEKSRELSPDSVED